MRRGIGDHQGKSKHNDIFIYIYIYSPHIIFSSIMLFSEQHPLLMQSCKVLCTVQRVFSTWRTKRMCINMPAEITAGQQRLQFLGWLLLLSINKRDGGLQKQDIQREHWSHSHLLLRGVFIEYKLLIILQDIFRIRRMTMWLEWLVQYFVMLGKTLLLIPFWKSLLHC